MERIRIVIMGAAGRDFHNFNTFFRDNEGYEVVAFTATQIPNIEGRCYPPELAGRLYPDGIPILAEEGLPEIVRERGVDQAVFAYSDVSHVDVMHKASWVLAMGVDFRLMGHPSTFIASTKPVISVTAVRTGAGKSQTTRRIIQILQRMGKRVVAIRHPMPYGDLVKQRVQRFDSYDDLDTEETTIEEREEYEPHIDKGIVVYAGVDYEEIVREAEKEADVIVWDGGNNDTSFYRSDLYIVIADPHRPGHEMLYYPGETNVRLADVVIINKVDTARRGDVDTVRENVRELNPGAIILEATSPITVDSPEMVRGKRILVIEDGPTVTHGGMGYGAGLLGAMDCGPAEIVDPRPWAVGSIVQTFKKYVHLERVLPAMGYGDEQVGELERTINACDCDVVVSGTPIDLRRVIEVNKPIVRVRYGLGEVTGGSLEEIIRGRLFPG